ncbi:MAG TPA: GNAT family N-acetyltransferase [Ktedonobacterales bacterium]|nr:GNAT family N-acetyltransferase [Ktedonobacterales bacterium]
MTREPLDPALLRFVPLALEHLPLLHTWLNHDHVAAWWHERPTYAEVVAEYTPSITGADPTHGYIIRYGEAPAGFIQWYRIADYPEYAAALAVEPGAIGVDLFIGEAVWLHRGLGSAALRRFVREVVFADAAHASCVIAPEPANRAAIRAYEKAGFRYLRTVTVPGEPAPEYVMRLARAEALT